MLTGQAVRNDHVGATHHFSVRIGQRLLLDLTGLTVKRYTQLHTTILYADMNAKKSEST